MAAVVEAIRSGDRFLVTSHESPDGDALGSLLAMHLALLQLGKDSVMALVGPAPLPGEYRFLDLEGHGLRRDLPADAAERVLLAVDCAQETRLSDVRLLDSRVVVNVDHHHDNTRFGTVNLVVADASSTAEMLADVLGALGIPLTPEIAEALYAGLVTDTGRFQYANTTPKALRLAAELLEAGADIQRIFQGVYESMQFAKAKLLARALDRATMHEEGRVVVSFLLRSDFGEVGAAEPYSEGIIDVCDRWRARSSPRSSANRFGTALRRGSLPQVLQRPDRRIGDRARLGRRGPSAGGRVLERPLDPRDHRVYRVRVRRHPGRPRLTAETNRDDSEGSGADRADPRRQACRPVLIRGPRRGALPHRREDRACGNARPVCHRAPAVVVRKGNQNGLMVRRSPQALPHGRRPLRTDDDRRPRGGPPRTSPGAIGRRTRCCARGPPRRRRAPDPCRLGGEDRGERAYRLHRRGVAVEMPRRRSHVAALDVIAYTDGIATLDLRVSSGTYVRSIADVLGGHCVALRRTEVGPFAVAEADPERIVAVDEALGRIGLTLGEGRGRAAGEGARRPGGCRPPATDRERGTGAVGP